MGRVVRASILVIAALGVVAAPIRVASAQSRHRKADPDQERREQEARELYEKGITHYNLGEFDPAVEAFKKAYELSNAPTLLFNIAQVYRAKEDYKQALHFYRAYLRLQPNAANRADVEARIADLQRLQSEKQRVQDAPPREAIPPGGSGQHQQTPPATGTGEDNPPPPPPPAVTPVTTSPSGSGHEADVPTGNGRTFKLVGLITAGVGVALVATGIAYGISASSASDDLSRLAPNGTPWSADAQQKYDDGQSAQTKMTAFLILGGAAAIGGGVLYYLGIRRDATTPTAALAPLPGGTAMVVTCRF
jgi:tetratricopeptide (TPR) repeat protein